MDWKNQLNMIQNKVKQQLHARKLDDLDSVRKLIDEFDIDRNGVLDKVEFSKLMSKAGIYLTTQELTCVYNFFDTNKDGFINYVEFIQLIRTQMSEKRLSIVKHAFQFLNINNEDRIKIEDLLRLYRPEDHPRVRTREKTVEQVFTEFKNAIRKKSSDGVYITEAEFLDYYADVNATLPLEKEDYFSDLVFKTWGITSGFNYVSPERIADLEAIIYEKIRQKTFVKEDEAKTIKKAFKYFDLEDSGTINIDQFNRALEKFGCIFNKHEINALFTKYDKDHSGKLCYDEFCNMFAIIGSGTNANVNPVFQLEREYPKDVIDQIRKDLSKRGLFGLRILAQNFKKADKLNRGGITRNECQWALKETGTTLTKHDMDKLYKYFDKKGDDFVRYPELITLVRGDISAQRADSIGNAWNRLSQGSLDAIKFDVLQSSFDPYALNDVRVGKTKPEHGFKEFLSQWEVRKDGTVGYQDFFNFYQDVSAMISENDIFDSLLRDSWRIAEPEKPKEVQPEQKTAKNLSVRFADNVNIK